jgi:hypothetical protein
LSESRAGIGSMPSSALPGAAESANPPKARTPVASAVRRLKVMFPAIGMGLMLRKLIDTVSLCPRAQILDATIGELRRV